MLNVGIVGLTTGDAALAALVGNRVMPYKLDQGTARPALTFQKAGGHSHPTFDTTGPQKERIQFDAHGSTYASCVAVLLALRNLLEGYDGVLSDGTYVQYCEWIDELDHYDEYSLDFRITAEYYFYFNLP
jgi:hypothetical protein